MPSVKGKKFPYTKKGKAAAKAYKKKTGSKKSLLLKVRKKEVGTNAS